MDKYRVLVVDDHTLFRMGVVTLINLQDNMETVAEADSGRAAMEMIPRCQPDIVVTDMQMPNGDGLWLSQSIRRRAPNIPVIVLTTFTGDFDVLNSIQAGAQGYLSKDSPREELIGAIQSVANGRQHLSPSAAAKVATVICTEKLTGREREILANVAEGLANKEIAFRLGITEGTVKTHMNNMMAKLGVAGRTEAVVTAVRRGIIHLP